MQFNSILKKLFLVRPLLLFAAFVSLESVSANAQNGHELWLRPVKAKPVNVICKQNSPTISIAKQELKERWLGVNNATVTLTIKKDKALKNDGFRLDKNSVQANTDIGILYGVYELLR